MGAMTILGPQIMDIPFSISVENIFAQNYLQEVIALINQPVKSQKVTFFKIIARTLSCFKMYTDNSVSLHTAFLA